MSGLGKLDPTLSRVNERWETADGHFYIVFSRAGRTWRLGTTNTAALVVRDAAGGQFFPRLRDAREHLLGSIYAEPHGWAHRVEEAFQVDRDRVYERIGDR